MAYRAKPLQAEPIAYPADRAELRWSRFIRLMAKVAERLETRESEKQEAGGSPLSEPACLASTPNGGVANANRQ